MSSNVVSERYLKFVERTLLEDEADSGAKSQLRLFLMGGPGVRKPQGRVKGYRVEVRPPKWATKIWVGTFPNREAARRAYDATMHYTGKAPFYYIYPEGHFHPWLLEEKEEFVKFVKRMAKEYSLDSRELVRNPISELLDLCVALGSGGDGKKEAASEFQTNFALSAGAAVPTQSSSEALSKENSDFMLDAQVIYLSDSSSDSEVTSDKEVKEVEEVEVVSNPFSLLFLEPDDVAFDYYQETIAATPEVGEETSFPRTDSPTAEDFARLLFNADDDVTGVDENLSGDAGLDDWAPILYCPDDDEVEPASKKRKPSLWAASFKVDAKDSRGMPGADNPELYLEPCLEAVAREDHNRRI